MSLGLPKSGPRLFFFMFRVCFLFILFSALNAEAQRFTKEVNNIAELLHQDPFDKNQAYTVRGYYSPGDGGGGVFVITNTVTATNIGTRIKIPGKTFSVERLHDGNIYTKWFGAKVDGFTDDSGFIQAALDYAYTNSFTVLLSPGNSIIATALIVKDNAKIIGVSGKSILSGAATPITMFISAKTNILLKDFQFAGTAENQLFVNLCKNVTLDSLTISGANLALGSITAGIHFEGCNGLTILNPILYGNGFGGANPIQDYNIMGGTFGNISTNVLIVNPTIINNNAKFGIVLYHQRDGTVRSANIDMGNIGNTNNASGYALVSYSLTADPNYNIVFDTPNIKNTYGSGIYFVNTQGGAVNSPILNNVALVQDDTTLAVGGISVNASTEIKLSNVAITNSGINSAVVFSSTTNCSLIGGSIKNPGTNQFAVEFRGANVGTAIKGITAYATIQTGRTGIGVVVGGSYITSGDIEGNFINNFTTGIDLQAGSTYNIIRANRINNTSVAGISDAGTGNVFDKNIISTNPTGFGFSLQGTKGTFTGNDIYNSSVGASISGAGYRTDYMNRLSNNNTVPLQDAGGSYIRTLTDGGLFPDFSDTVTYSFNYPSPVIITNFDGGLPGTIRTITTVNTNVIITNGVSITLDGITSYQLYPGDLLSFVKDLTGVWRQVGRSINTNWQSFDRVSNSLNVSVKENLTKQLSILAPKLTSDYLYSLVLSNNNANANIESVGAVGLAFPARTLQTDAASNYVQSFFGGLKVIPYQMTNAVVNANAAKVQYHTLTNNDTYTFINFTTGSGVLLGLTNSGAFIPAFSGVTWLNGSPTIPTNSLSFLEFIEYMGLIIGINPTGGTNAGGSGTNIVFANPTGLIGMSAVNGSATTATRSDATHAIDPTITPTWSGLHLFSSGASFGALTNLVIGINNDIIYTNNGFPHFYVKNTNGYAAMSITPDGSQADFRGRSSIVSIGSDIGGGVILMMDNTSSSVRPASSNAVDSGSLVVPWRHINLSGHISWNGAINTVFDLAGTGSPEGVVTATRGSIYRRYDGGAATTVYAKTSDTGNIGWIALTTGSAGSLNWIDSGLTNAFINGNATASLYISTNGYQIPGGASFTSNALNGRNGGGDFAVQQNSNVRLSTTTLSGGSGAETWLRFKAGNAFVGIWDTNKVLESFFGINTDNLVSTNAILIPSGGTGTNSMGTQQGNIPFLSTVTNRLDTDNANFMYDKSSGILEVVHQTTTIQPHYLALNNDTGAILEMFADKLIQANTDLTIENLSNQSIFFNMMGTNVFEINTTNAVFSRGIIFNRFATATNYTAKSGDYYIVATATLTNTLPAASTMVSGKVFIVKNKTGTTTVRPTGADTIDGVAADDSLTSKAAHRYISDGVSNWEIF